MCKEKKDEEHWQWDEAERAYIPEDDEMLAQLPQEDSLPASWLGEYQPDPEAEVPYEYGIAYDRVLTLPLDLFSEEEASLRFKEQCMAERYRPTERMFYTARAWCLRVVKVGQ